MQPLNKKERSKAFWKFFFLFLLCIVLVGTTLFMSILVPFKQNDQMRNQISEYQKDHQFSDEFTTKMSIITQKLDSINFNPAKADLMDSEISGRIDDLYSRVERDSVSHKTFFRNVVLLLRDLRLAKQQIRETSGKDASASELRMQISQLEKDLEDKKSKILDLETKIHNLVKTN